MNCGKSGVLAGLGKGNPLSEVDLPLIDKLRQPGLDRCAAGPAQSSSMEWALGLCRARYFHH